MAALPIVPLDNQHVMLPLPTSPNESVSRAVVLRAQKSRRSLVSAVPSELKQLSRQKIAAEPFVKINVLLSFAASSSIHAICLQRKARVVAGLGIKAVTKAPERKYRSLVRRAEHVQDLEKDEGKQEVEDAKKQLKLIDVEQKKLQGWLDKAGGQLPLREVLERAWYDWENLGWAALEVIRNAKGETESFVHAPAHLVRVMKDGMRYVYLKSVVKPVYYKKFGIQKHLNAETGEWSDKPLDDEKEANELLFWNQYSPLDPYYGVPAWFPALAELIGSGEARDMMLTWFTRRAMPAFAVIFEGKAWNDETIDAVQRFFRTDLPGDHNATLAVEVPEGGKITFERISEDPRGFVLVQRYLETVRDAIISSHGMLPAIVGVIETAHLGAGTDESQMNTFKTTEIRPKQEILENILNTNFVWQGLGLKTQMLKLDEIDLWDEAAEVNKVSSLYCNAQRPAMTPNEARKCLRLDPVEEDGADELLFAAPTGGFMTLPMAMDVARQAQQQASGMSGGGEGGFDMGGSDFSNLPLFDFEGANTNGSSNGNG